MRKKKADHRTRVGAERSARTDTRILEAALIVFAKMGPDAPKIDDFVDAAGISRGTFYNHFESVEELLGATSEWTTRGLIESIEKALVDVEGPALRFGLGLRLFLTKAQSDVVWSKFVARVWKLGGIELPTRDLRDGIRLGQFRAPDVDAAQDVVLGAMREALLRIGSDETPRDYAAHVTTLCLQALGVDARRITAVLEHTLPSLSATVEEETR